MVNRTATGKKVTHGAGAYRNHGCRCAICTRENTVYGLAYRHRTGRNRPKGQWEAERPKAQHGGKDRYLRHGCRCDLCVEGERARRAAERAKARQRPIPDHVHGTINGYTNYACRCDECRGEYRKRRAKRRGRTR